MVESTSNTVSSVSSLRTTIPVECRRVLWGFPGEEFLGRTLRPVPVGCVHTRRQGKRRADRRPSNRSRTLYREGYLRRGGERRYLLGQGVFLRFGKNWQGCLVVRYLRTDFAAKVTHLTSGALLLLGIVGGKVGLERRVMAK